MGLHHHGEKLIVAGWKQRINGGHGGREHREGEEKRDVDAAMLGARWQREVAVGFNVLFAGVREKCRLR
jgi:hypothetical protein